MAALIKLRNMSLVRISVGNHLLKNCRNISTSKKNRDTATTCDTAAEEKNWVSYGFDYKSKEEDTNAHHASFFFSVTLCLVFGGFFWAYAPDVHMRDWAQREAYLELHRREKAGLRPIDPDFVNRNSIKLPSEAELENVEIVI